MFINQGRASEALPYFEQACAQNPNDEITRCKMAALYLELNMKDEAYREYLRAAESYAVRGELEKTLSIYNILIMLQPGAVKARKQLAVLFSRLGRPDAAAEQLKWVMDFYMHYGQLKGAIEACDQLIEVAPENALGRRLKGVMLLQMAKRVEGVREFEEAARLFLLQNERDQALATIEEGLKVAPANPRLRELHAQAETMAPSEKPRTTPEETVAAEEAFIAWLRDVDAKLDFQTPPAGLPAAATATEAAPTAPAAPPWAIPPPVPAPAAPPPPQPSAPPPVSGRSQYETAEILPGDIRVSRCLADIADLTTSQVENMREEIIMMFNEARRTYEEGLVSDWELRVIKEFYKAFNVAVEIHRKGENPNPPAGPKPS
jgi:tetratricopeptide (TPR) repeat protein